MQHSRTRRLVLRLGARRPGSLTCAVPRGGHVRLWGAGGARGAPACPQSVRGSIPRPPGPSRSSGRPPIAADRDGGDVVATSEGPRLCDRGAISVAVGQCGGSKRSWGAFEAGRSAGGGSGSPGCAAWGSRRKRGAREPLGALRAQVPYCRFCPGQGHKVTAQARACRAPQPTPLRTMERGRTGWSAKAEGSGRRVSGAGGAQEAELAHLRPLSEFNLD